MGIEKSLNMRNHAKNGGIASQGNRIFRDVKPE